MAEFPDPGPMDRGELLVQLRRQIRSLGDDPSRRDVRELQGALRLLRKVQVAIYDESLPPIPDDDDDWPDSSDDASDDDSNDDHDCCEDEVKLPAPPLPVIQWDPSSYVRWQWGSWYHTIIDHFLDLNGNSVRVVFDRFPVFRSVRTTARMSTTPRPDNGLLKPFEVKVKSLDYPCRVPRF